MRQVFPDIGSKACWGRKINENRDLQKAVNAVEHQLYIIIPKKWQ